MSDRDSEKEGRDDILATDTGKDDTSICGGYCETGVE